MNEIFSGLEKERKSLSIYCVINNILFGISILIAFLLRFSNGELIDNLFVPFIIFILAAISMRFLITNKKVKAYKTGYKRQIVEDILKNSFTDLYFDAENGMPEETIENTGMMSMGNLYNSNDYIKGRYKDISFEQADVLIQRKGKHTYTYFKGRWMVFDFNKSFASNLLVKEKSFAHSKTNSSWFTPETERFIKIKLEDSVFNSDFDVYTDNQHEAYYILTPHFMQNIMKLNDVKEGELILCFSESKLHVGIYDDTDAFEPPIYSPLDENIVQSIKDELTVITQFVDELKLDRNLYKQN
ncbi:MAG: hypothetical protein A2Y15_09190 [Clostridiales bacterium GWF2_36_10]|nr:MAG: hypothetical protein A2Y15_09190 [Clostridiales bacterium GWF2_36_10]HAN21446.1 hypothetical protein [Clostridiales bacterium]